MRIRHVPLGSGHPYTDDTEQRSPTLPVAGESVRVGARTSADVESVTLHWSVTNALGEVTHHSAGAKQVARSSRGQNVDGGHLASAQARLARRQGGWEAHLSLAADAVGLEYYFVAAAGGAEKRTRTYTTPVGQWVPADPGVVQVSDPARPALNVLMLVAGGRIRRVRFSFSLADKERVVGFGERYDRLDHRGTELDSMVFEQYKSQGEHRRTYMPMPFAHVVGASGWGFHVETSRRVWFDVGAADPGLLTIEAQTNASVGERALTVQTFDGGPTAVLDAFLERVGRPEELPAWVFRLWASGNEWNTQAEVERQLALHREHDVPVGAVVIEAWSDESSFTIFRDARYTPRQDGGPMRLADFTFPPDGAWPDPVGMVRRMHADDIKVLLWQIPLIKMRPHPQGQAKHDAEAAIREGRLIQERSPEGKLRPYRNRGWWFPLSLMPDLTDPEAARWWTDKRRYLVEELDIDGFKTDGGEHAWGEDLHYLDGRSGDEANNTFATAYAKAYGDLLRSAGKAPVTFSRAGFTGSQAHGAFWAGDENSTWDAFRWSIHAGLSASACGVVYWGWDIGGFSGPVPEPELYVRAFAASAFMPIMQYHSEFNHHKPPKRDRTPWNVAELTGDDQIISEISEIVHLRERLVPYLERQARVSVETSQPLMRALFFDTDDERVWDYPLQWMLGDDLLVAPVLEPGANWDVFVPEGQWRDAWTGEAVTGGQVISTSTPRQRVPVFVRETAWEQLQTVFTDRT